MDWQPREDFDRPVYRDEADIFNAMDERQRSAHNEYMIQCMARRDETQRKKEAAILKKKKEEAKQKEEEERRVKRKRELNVTRTDAYTELKKAFDEMKDENKAIKGDLIAIKEENNTLRESYTMLIDERLTKAFDEMKEVLGTMKEENKAIREELDNVKREFDTPKEEASSKRNIEVNTALTITCTTPVETNDTRTQYMTEPRKGLKRMRIIATESTKTKECVSCKVVKPFSCFETKTRKKNKEGHAVDYISCLSMCHSCRNKKYRSCKKDKIIQ